ncbi:hypothetical protein DTO021D3_2948 [Paecilomyces variotii]|nr:hypothetical protein DTO032I3_8816 [Paecilomyces variotii]KAJ9280031.1 hypothetical protein DTO021D3_2948 [Paecilomyces variotii]KAJ9340344.1 hypothetical protein DTO027B6_7046 [Paecilomyces variotii]KAJ9356914.1 hypothetical protein DTO027B9_3398 [Paecilomyces variotii]KAJ9375676.1 hypothetical protein DTO032I4_8937 [Paecilomyces variotii]
MFDGIALTGHQTQKVATTKLEVLASSWLSGWSTIRNPLNAEGAAQGLQDDGSAPASVAQKGDQADANSQREGQKTPDSAEDVVLPRDRQQKTPSYNYAYEKSMSHAEARLFYQRQLASRNAESEPQSPTLAARDDLPSRAHSRMSSRGFSGPNGAPEVTAAPYGPRTSAPHPGMLASSQNTTSYARLPAEVLIAADQSARSHAMHPGLPHEHKPYLLATEGIHGAGAGIGVGQGAGGYAPSDEAVTSELSLICRKIQNLLDMRNKYITLSLQGPGHNPKDQPGWRIYPSPPEPVWGDDLIRNGQTDKPRKKRKMGQDIGEDFDMEELMPLPGPSNLTFRLDRNSVYQVYETEEAADLGEPIVQIPSLRDFYMALDAIIDVSTDGPIKTFAFKRLSYLEGKFQLHTLLNEYQEVADSKKVPHRDFYNVRKVDTHVHHSACMNQKHLLRFIKSKMKKSPDEVVLFRDGKHLTLKEVFESINLTAYDLSIDTLDMHAHTDTFHRFDKFNLKYNPVGESRLREIFLKTDNYIKGRYLAEITKEVMSDLESSKYQMAEWRISIYGRSIDEWDKLAAWVVDNKLFSPNIRWLIQVPRLYDVYKSSGMMETFEQVITNVFQPLFEVTKDPSSHPKLHIFLERVIGFDSVDDESKAERRLYKKYPIPREWDTKQNPPYSYWIYFMFANMASLNTWRKQRGFNTFVLRPHCGEAGDPDHLAAGFLCCEGISHGILLRKVPLLQYLFYLDQIGIAMSPLSNNALFLTYDKNPFAGFFKKGLNVSLSTDDPLQFAFTKEPLIEEYSVAAQIYKFSAVDMCELAKRSVMQSGFEMALKQRWLGADCLLPGVAGNNVAKSNVPDIREAYRHETLVGEISLIERYAAYTSPNVPGTPAKEPPRQPFNPNVSPLFSAKSAAATGTPPVVVGDSDSPINLHSQLAGLNIDTGSTTNDTRTDTRATSPIPQAWNAGQDASFAMSGNAAAASAAGSGPSNVPEQKLFPGIVHERARRSSMMTNASAAGERPKLKRDKDTDNANESAIAYDYAWESDDD